MNCYVVTSGVYDTYTVHGVYASRDDARAHVRAVNEKDMREKHDRDVATGYVPPNAQYTCKDPIKTCPGCGKYFADLDHWTLRWETYPFVPVGGKPFEIKEKDVGA